MFGYIYVNDQEMKLKDLRTYRGFYCGLCEELKDRYGREGQLLLSYDLTFLAILMSGLYEPHTVRSEGRCLIHPAAKHLIIRNDAVSYAADMCVLLSWHKLMDDWKDEKKALRKVLADRLKKDYQSLAEQYPRQTRAVERNLHQLSRAERQGKKDLDLLAGYTGAFLGEVFVWKDDIWQNDLRRMGFYLGKFIYLMDAVEDVAKDRKKGNFNPFSDTGIRWGTPQEEEIQSLLMQMMAQSSGAFERLPVVEYAPIIRNILYSGVWSKYSLIRMRELKKQKKKQQKKQQIKRQSMPDQTAEQKRTRSEDGRTDAAGEKEKAVRGEDR